MDYLQPAYIGAGNPDYFEKFLNDHRSIFLPGTLHTGLSLTYFAYRFLKENRYFPNSIDSKINISSLAGLAYVGFQASNTISGQTIFSFLYSTVANLPQYLFGKRQDKRSARQANETLFPDLPIQESRVSVADFSMKIERDLNLIDQTLDHILSGLASVEPIRESSTEKRLIERKKEGQYRPVTYGEKNRLQDHYYYEWLYSNYFPEDLEFFRIIPALEVSADGYFGLTEHEYNHVKGALNELDPDLANSIRESQAYNHARNRFSS